MVTDCESEAYQQAVEALDETGRMDVALERISVPLIPDGYERSDLVRSSLFLLTLCFVAVLLMTFACQALLPTYQSFYDDAKLPYSTGLLNLLWVRDVVMPVVGWIGLAIMAIGVSVLYFNRFDLPWFTPGRVAYRAALSKISQARAEAKRGSSDRWRVIERHYRAEAISIATRLKALLPLFFGVVLGGALVAAYAYTLFLPIVQMLYDLSDVEAMVRLQHGALSK